MSRQLYSANPTGNNQVAMLISPCDTTMPTPPANRHTEPPIDPSDYSDFTNRDLRSMNATGSCPRTLRGLTTPQSEVVHRTVACSVPCIWHADFFFTKSVAGDREMRPTKCGPHLATDIYRTPLRPEFSSLSYSR